VAPAYHLHPEFGLLCPSPKFRRGAKVTLACLAGSIIIGALALQVSHERGADGAVLISHGDAAATNLEPAPTVGRAAMTAEVSPVPEGSATACEGDASNRDPKCGMGKVRKLKSHLPRPPAPRTQPIATSRPPQWLSRRARVRRRRRASPRAGLAATIGRANGECPARNGARGPMRPTTLTCAAATNPHGAPPGKTCRRDRLNRTHLEG